MCNIAVILCAGKGIRFGQKKQFVKLAGKPVCIHTLDVFIKSQLFDKIFVVVAREDIKLTISLIKKYYGEKILQEKIVICEGGHSRQESSKKAVECILKEGFPLNTKVLIHDCVRPFVDTRILQENLENINENQATDTVIDAIDTIVKVTPEGYIEEIPPRKYLKYGQTPQGFLLQHLIQMYKNINTLELQKYTDDCGIFLKTFPNKKIKTIKGSYYNIKITTPLDIYIADKIFFLKKEDLYIPLSKLKEKEVEIINMLKNKVIVIFGNSSGIGKAIYELGRRWKLRIYGTSRSKGTNIRHIEDVRGFLEKVYNKEGQIDHIIVTAGVLVKKPLINMSYEEIFEQVETNYLGSIIVTKEALPYLIRNPGKPKHIILFSSSSYTRGRGTYSVYSSTKAALVNFIQALCEEFDNINFNAVVPERTNTPMRKRWFGVENESTLLKPETVAWYTLYILTRNVCGIAFEVRKDMEK